MAVPPKTPDGLRSFAVDHGEHVSLRRRDADRHATDMSIDCRPRVSLHFISVISFENPFSWVCLRYFERRLYLHYVTWYLYL